MKSLGNLPSSDEKGALAGNNGTPSSSNTFSTETGNIVGLKSGGTEYTKTRIKFAQSGSSGLTVTEDGTDLLVTISAFRSTAPLADSGSGVAGSSGEFADGAHQHPLSDAYKLQVDYYDFSITNWSSDISFNPGFYPVAAFAVAHSGVPLVNIMHTGIGFSTTRNNQGGIWISYSGGGLGSSYDQTYIISYGLSRGYYIDAWTNTSVNLTSTGSDPGLGTLDGGIVVVGNTWT
jgi:hypothetical protein